MKIAYITDQILPRTATDAKQMVSMVSALGRAGSEVTLVTPRRWFSRASNRDRIASFYEVSPSFSIQSVHSVYPNIRAIEKLAQGLAGPLTRTSRKADVLYTRTIPILIGALFFTRRHIVYETYRPWPVQRPHSAGFFRWLGRRRRFLGAVLHSELARRSYAEAGVPVEKLMTAYNAFDSSHLQPALTQMEARVACGLPPDRKTVVYTGRLSKRKGVDILLDLARELPDVTFVLVGSQQNGAIEKDAARLPNVVVCPWIPDSRIAPYLYAADVLIIPPTVRPLREAGNTVLPIKTFQYMAAGRAILAPSTPDITEILVDGENACLVPPDETVAARDRLKVLLSDEAVMAALGRRALETSRGLSWERRAECVLAFIFERLGNLHHVPSVRPQGEERAL
ncbi:MAG TPA: glycosyltransferase [Rhodothermales bacterium]|nr:glycosyltransferase [Rhodothermales bacterium]